MKRFLTLPLLLLVCSVTAFAQPEYIPNDPQNDLAHARAINLLKAYAKILEIEQNSSRECLRQ